MKRLRAVAPFFIVLLMAITALSCSSGDKSSVDEPGNGDTQPTGNSSGATLRLTGPDPLTLDPALASDASSASYVVEIFDGLVTIDKDLQIVPDIAKSWDISADGKVYTFRLRDNVFFHGESRAVTADDFKYSMERAANPDTASITAEAYLGDIVGAKDMVNGDADSISGVEVVDNFTLRITIDAAKPYFLAKLSYPTAFVVDRMQVEGDKRNWTKKPRGTGPYMVEKWELTESLTLKANDKYHLGAPAVKKIEFLLAGGSVMTMYENAEIDVSPVGINDIDRVTDPNDSLNADYMTANSMSISYIGFNVNEAPFDDPKVRQAFGMAIDRDKITEVVVHDMLPVAHSIMPPGLPGYNPNAKTLSYDPERAKQLLAESKYADDMPKVTLSDVGAGATAGQDTQAMIEMWKTNLGIEIEIVQTDEATFWQDLDKGEYQMFTAGWVMDYPDPEDILDILFYSQSRQNNTQYSNPQVDDLLVQARTEQDTAKRMALYQQAEQIILDDAAWIPLYNGRDHILVKPYVKGYLLPPMVIPRLKYISIVQ